ncbi:MAG TPA: hypothetical protein VN605_12435 [Thermoanaerobaculia bacterium]|nr:hypothetical protein [Thermoanaerobaculia bacterium]
MRVLTEFDPVVDAREIAVTSAGDLEITGDIAVDGEESERWRLVIATLTLERLDRGD